MADSSLFEARHDALDYIATNPDEHESRLLAALLSELDSAYASGYQAGLDDERF